MGELRHRQRYDTAGTWRANRTRKKAPRFPAVECRWDYWPAAPSANCVFRLDGRDNTDFGLPEQPGRVARTTSPSLDATFMTWRSIAGILARVEGRRVVSGRLELLGES